MPKEAFIAIIKINALNQYKSLLHIEKETKVKPCAFSVFSSFETTKQTNMFWCANFSGSASETIANEEGSKSLATKNKQTKRDGEIMMKCQLNQSQFHMPFGMLNIMPKM